MISTGYITKPGVSLALVTVSQQSFLDYPRIEEQEIE